MTLAAKTPSSSPATPASGTPYHGMNILLLWGEAVAKGYAAPIWMTYQQARELGANVRTGEDTEREIPFLKGYTVFNAEQVDGLPAHYYAQPENPLPLPERIENAAPS